MVADKVPKNHNPGNREYEITRKYHIFPVHRRTRGIPRARAVSKRRMEKISGKHTGEHERKSHTYSRARARIRESERRGKNENSGLYIHFHPTIHPISILRFVGTLHCLEYCRGTIFQNDEVSEQCIFPARVVSPFFISLFFSLLFPLVLFRCRSPSPLILLTSHSHLPSTLCRSLQNPRVVSI